MYVKAGTSHRCCAYEPVGPITLRGSFSYSYRPTKGIFWLSQNLASSEADLESIHTLTQKVIFAKKQTKHGHFKVEFSCHIQDPSNFGQPPQPCTKQHYNTYMPLTHWFPSRGPKPISLVFRHSHCLNLQWPSKTFIHPPRMTMTDLATKRSICILLSFFFFLLPLSYSLCSLFVLFTSFYCYFVDVQNMMKKWDLRWLWQSAMWE